VPRVLHVYEPPDGGVADSVLRLAEGLGAQGWESEVAGPPDSIFRAPIEATGTPFHPLPLRRGYGAPHADARALRALTALVRRVAPDVLHAHSAKAGVLGRLAAVATRTPWAFSPQCFAYVGPVSPARKVFGTVVEGALGHLGRGTIVAVCDAERREALRHRSAPDRRIDVVYNSSPPCPYVAPDPDVLAFRGDGPLAACLAVLREQKALHVFLEAAPRILEQVPQARLAIIGDGPEQAALEARAAELGLDRDERFAFFGFRAPPATGLLAMDVFVLPSAWEAFPIAVLEAMACGRPVVATDVGGTREAVVDGETGRMIPSYDAEAIVGAVVPLLRDGALRERMGAAGRARHAERFTVDVMARDMAAAYARLIARRGPAR
jgi:glycosyltransferase involved in cell wall biosynthesis